MRLFLLTALTMTAFAANSVLNRMAVGHYGMPPESFAIVRALSGAIVLWALVAARGRKLPLSDWSGRLIGAGALALAKHEWASGFSGPLVVMLVVYTLFALGFGWLVFGRGAACAVNPKAD